MAKSGPIIIIDDDTDDQEIVVEIIKELGLPNELIVFSDCAAAFNYLKKTEQQPFIILSDINLPLMSGLELKKNIDADPQLRQRSIPFIFLSTAANPQLVTKAYLEMSIQGFFKKQADMVSLKRELSIILEYWRICKHPNSEMD